MFFRSACTTNVNASMSFGGKSWPISFQDLNTGRLPGVRNLCQGAFFDLSLGSNKVGAGPDWVIGDTFLVRNISRMHFCFLFLVPFSRKMCTRCSVFHHRLLGLPSCLLRLVDQVRNSLGRSRAHTYTHVYYHCRNGFFGL